MRTGDNAAGRGAHVATRPDNGEPLVDMFGLIEMLFRRKWLILGTAALVTILALALLYIMGPRYQGTARILIDPRELRVVENELLQRGLGNDLVLVESQVEIIQSEAVLMRVVDRENLVEDEEFFKPSTTATSADTGRSPREVALESLARATKVARADNTYVIEISVVSREPAKAARLANAVAAAYTADQSDATAGATRNVNASIQQRLDELQTGLREAEARVATFKQENDLGDADGRMLLDTRLNELSTRLSDAVTRTAEARSRLEVIEQAMSQRGDVSSVVSDTENGTMMELRAQLTSAQRRLAELEQTLGPLHPRLGAARAEVEQVRSAIRAESERLVAATRDAYRAAQDTEDRLAENLRNLTTESFAANEQLIQLRELERQAQAGRLVYETFLVRARETAEQENIGARTARVIAPAAVPDSPAFPPRSLLLIVAMVFGFGLGVFNAIVADLWERRRLQMAAAGAGGVDAVPARHVADAVGLDPSRDRIVMAVSADNEDAARVAAFNMARETADAGKTVLLIDLPPRERGGPAGLAELSTGAVRLSDVLTRDPYSSAHIVHGGRAHQTVQVDAFREAFDLFTEAYDRIVVNAGLLDGRAGPIGAEIIGRAGHLMLVVGDDRLSPSEQAAFRELSGIDGATVTILSLEGEGPVAVAA